MDADLVIKVKYGETLRRFGVSVNDKGTLDMGMSGLVSKILDLFKLPTNADVILTYVDEDKDIVTLVDDNDLRDAIGQYLNPLRINVQLNSTKDGKLDERSSESSNPVSPPQVQGHPLSHINSGLSEMLKSLPEPLSDVLMKVSRDLASKAASSTPVHDERSSESSNPVSSPQVQGHPLSHINSGLSEMLKSLPEPLSDVLMKVSRDLASKAASSTPVLNELLELLVNTGLSPLAPGSMSQSGMIPVSQGNASHSPTDNKDTDEDSEASQNLVSNSQVLPHTESVRPGEANNSKKYDSGNGTRGVGTSISPTATVGQMVDLPKGSNHLGHRTVNNSAPAVLASNALSSGKGKLPQKESDVPLNGKPFVAAPSSSTDSLLHYPDLTYAFGDAIPPTEIFTPRGLVVSDGDKGEQIPVDRGDSSVSYANVYPQDNCPFSGTNVGRSVVPPGGYFRSHPFKRSYSRCDSMGRIFHKGIRCDGCGVHPITGPRFKSKVKEDYDLCSICFSEMGSEAEYTRIDRPVSIRSPWLLDEFCDPHAQFQGPVLPRLLLGRGKKLSRPNLDSCFIQDVNILDGTIVSPGTPFTKIWRMRNNGSIQWPHGTQLVWIGGNQFTTTGSLAVDVEVPFFGLTSAKELDIAVNFTAPERPGRYISYWRLALPSGKKFGQRIWVLIQVDASAQHPLPENFHSLNLNMPPEHSGLEGQIIDMDVEVVDDVNSRKEESMKPVADEQRKTQGFDFPTNDSLLCKNDSVPTAPEMVPALSLSPPLDLSDGLTEPSGVVADGPTIRGQMNDSANLEVEESLLKELEEMGFKEIDLNKEVLRMNEYNMEQSVDDLCGVSEWDPILEELQEMGFHDNETNKKLLMKNGGSIKRVVMDLVAGEMA